jgi:hypothetical protein
MEIICRRSGRESEQKGIGWGEGETKKPRRVDLALDDLKIDFATTKRVHINDECRIKSSDINLLVQNFMPNYRFLCAFVKMRNIKLLLKP